MRLPCGGAFCDAFFGQNGPKAGGGNCGKENGFSTVSTGFSTASAKKCKKKREKAGFLREKSVENSGENVEKSIPWGKPVESTPPAAAHCGPEPRKKESTDMNKKQKKNLYRIIAALVLVLILKLLPQS